MAINLIRTVDSDKYWLVVYEFCRIVSLVIDESSSRLVSASNRECRDAGQEPIAKAQRRAVCHPTPTPFSPSVSPPSRPSSVTPVRRSSQSPFVVPDMSYCI